MIFSHLKQYILWS